MPTVVEILAIAASSPPRRASRKRAFATQPRLAMAVLLLMENAVLEPSVEKVGRDAHRLPIGPDGGREIVPQRKQLPPQQPAARGGLDVLPGRRGVAPQCVLAPGAPAPHQDSRPGNVAAPPGSWCRRRPRAGGALPLPFVGFDPGLAVLPQQPFVLPRQAVAAHVAAAGCRR
ncbi:MAG: hypothetical protein IPO75_17200 [Betaproteobacteria bacterium]|nr:hypothetical protein [Betaproteobacteria bacterium]